MAWLAVPTTAPIPPPLLARRRPTLQSRGGDPPSSRGPRQVASRDEGTPPSPTPRLPVAVCRQRAVSPLSAPTPPLENIPTGAGGPRREWSHRADATHLFAAALREGSGGCKSRAVGRGGQQPFLGCGPAQIRKEPRLCRRWLPETTIVCCSSAGAPFRTPDSAPHRLFRG